MKSILYISFHLMVFFTGCSGPGGKVLKKSHSAFFRFALGVPDHRYELPKSLHEISGIAVVSNTIVACIADEKGIVYFYDLKKGAIVNQLQFTGKGDFEDLAIIKDAIYVLDSKGTIWILKNYSRLLTIQSFSLMIAPPFELEGLCLRSDTLFIAVKYYHNKKRNSPGILPVWKITLANLQAPSILFFLPDIFQDSSGRDIQFHTSGILYDDISNEWLCISTHSKMMIRCDYIGNVMNKELLSEQVLPHAEGICFTPFGDLLISSEGKDGAETISLFHPKMNTQ